MTEIPRIVSADDHVVEPPDVWTSRLPGEVPRRRAARRARAGGGDDVPRRQVRATDGRATTGRSPTGGSTRTSNARTRGSARARGSRPRTCRSCPMTYDEMRPGCYQHGAAPRRHGPQLGRGVAVLPDVPALLRPDVPRGRRQGPRAAVRAGLQRLDGRGVVRGLGRPPDPAVPHPAVGPGARGGRGAAQRRRAACAPSASRSCPATSACRRCTTRTATGTRSSPRATRPAPSSACTAARGRRCRRPRPTRRRRCRRRSPTSSPRARWPTGCSPGCSCATRT